MSYPYGQGYPGQPGDPQQPGYPPPPQPPGFGQPGTFGPPPYGVGPAQPSSFTAVTAAILAGIGGVVGLGGSVLGLIGIVAVGEGVGISGGTYVVAVVSLVLNRVLGVALLAGAVLLFQRKMLGRWLVVAGCVTSIVVSVVSLAAGAFMAGPYGAVGVFDVAANLVGLLFPIATIAPW